LEVFLIGTEGRGGEAVVEIGDTRLSVVDSISGVGEPRSPGPIPDARLEIVAIERLSGRADAADPPGMQLVREWGWRYRGCGEVVSTEPLRIDFGPFSCELGFEPVGVTCGEHWTIAIDRIVLSRGKTSRADR